LAAILRYMFAEIRSNTGKPGIVNFDCMSQARFAGRSPTGARPRKWKTSRLNKTSQVTVQYITYDLRQHCSHFSKDSPILIQALTGRWWSSMTVQNIRLPTPPPHDSAVFGASSLNPVLVRNTRLLWLCPSFGLKNPLNTYNDFLKSRHRLRSRHRFHLNAANESSLYRLDGAVSKLPCVGDLEVADPLPSRCYCVGRRVLQGYTEGSCGFLGICQFAPNLAKRTAMFSDVRYCVPVPNFWATSRRSNNRPEDMLVGYRSLCVVSAAVGSAALECLIATFR
jgi:hypothetical protein